LKYQSRYQISGLKFKPGTLGERISTDDQGTATYSIRRKPSLMSCNTATNECGERTVHILNYFAVGQWKQEPLVTSLFL